jgi:flagellar hook assembly protein FlgD
MSSTKISGNEFYEKNGSLLVEAKVNNLTDIQITEIIDQFKCYPNPFTQEISIEIHNQNQGKITVEIYNMAGQRIKTLFKGLNNGNLILKWNGTNDSGQKVVPGVYMCKVNDQSKKLIYESIKVNKNE